MVWLKLDCSNLKIFPKNQFSGVQFLPTDFPNLAASSEGPPSLGSSWRIVFKSKRIPLANYGHKLKQVGYTKSQSSFGVFICTLQALELFKPKCNGKLIYNAIIIKCRAFTQLFTVTSNRCCLNNCDSPKILLHEVASFECKPKLWI